MRSSKHPEFRTASFSRPPLNKSVKRQAANHLDPGLRAAAAAYVAVAFSRCGLCGGRLGQYEGNIGMMEIKWKLLFRG